MKVPGILVVVAAALAGMALAASAAGTSAPGTKTTRPHGTVTALALDGTRVAFGNGPAVYVWDFRAGKTTNMHMGEDAFLEDLAIAGSRVVSYWRWGSNFESGDYLVASSLQRPKGHVVATESRTDQAQCGAASSGHKPACAGTWLGGLVGSGTRILVNRWTTDAKGTVSNAGLYALVGSKLELVAGGPEAVEAVAADSHRVAVVQWQWYPPGRAIRVYSSSGRQLSRLSPKGFPLQVAVSGRNLVVLERTGNLALYDADTGVLRRTFDLHATEPAKNERSGSNPRGLQALAVHGNIAVYSRPVRRVGGIPRESAIYAVNLSSGRSRLIGRSPGQITSAAMDAFGLLYATGDAPRNSIVFVPFARVAGAVS